MTLAALAIGFGVFLAGAAVGFVVAVIVLVQARDEALGRGCK